MNNQFDELTKSMAQSVTRRAALKQFGVGLAGMALACFGLVNSAHAGKVCSTDTDCKPGKVCSKGVCVKAPSEQTCLPSGSYGCKHNNDCCSKMCRGGWYGFPKYCQ